MKIIIKCSECGSVLDELNTESTGIVEFQVPVCIQCQDNAYESGMERGYELRDLESLDSKNES